MSFSHVDNVVGTDLNGSDGTFGNGDDVDQVKTLKLQAAFTVSNDCGEINRAIGSSIPNTSKSINLPGLPALEMTSSVVVV